MKPLIIILAMLWLLPRNILAQKKNQERGVAAFYNLENLFDTENNPIKDDDDFTPAGINKYTGKVYSEKLRNLAKVLQQLGTDVAPDGAAIIGLAEVENRQVLDALAGQPEIKGRNYRYVWYDSPDPRGIDVALLYNPKYFKVLASRAIRINLDKTAGKELTRDVLYVSGIFSGDTVQILVNHWPSRRGGETATASKRAIVAQVNKRLSDSLLKANPYSKILIMGDLNDNPVDESIAKVLGTSGIKENIILTSLYNPWVDFYKKGMGTSVYKTKWNLFDQIILSGAMLNGKDNGWKFYKAAIFNKDFLLEKSGRHKGSPHRSYSGRNWINGYSDHLPVMVYLTKEQT